MQEEEKKDGILDDREGPPREEDLRTADPPEPEPGEDQTTPEPTPEELDRNLNYQIPYAVGQIAWPNEAELAQRYVNTTGPILNLIDFHTCLGPMGQLPPTARLIIGCAAIIGGVVMIKVGQARKEKDEQRQKQAGSVLRETTEEAENDQFPGPEKEKTSGDGSQQQRAPGFRKVVPSPGHDQEG